MEEKCCFRCGTKHLINDINYQMENCLHIYCANCIFQNIFIKGLSYINEIEKFTVNCKCENGSIDIPMESVEELFSKKYTVDSEEIKEKDYCSKHKNVEKTLFCKNCEQYVCPQCTKLNDDEEVENDNRNNILEINEHDGHTVVKAEKLCNKYKDFLKDIQIENKTVNQFVEKFNIEISKYESELENEINSTLKQIDNIIDKLYHIKDEYTKILEKKYSNCNRLLKIIKLFYANYYLDYENRMNINDIFTLKYLKDVNYEFSNLDFIRDTKESSLENILLDIKTNLDRIHLKKEQGGRFVETLTISELTGDIVCLYELIDLRIISTIKTSGAMKIWTKKKDSESYKLALTLSEHKMSVTCIVQLPDERLITGSKDKTIIVWDVSENSFKCKQIISEHKDGVFSLCHLTGVRFASGSDDKTIRIWEEEKEKHLFRCVNILKELKTRVTALALTNNGYLISGGDKVIIVYKLKDSKFIKCANCKAHAGYITKIIKLSDGKIASAGRDNLIKIWNEKNGELFLSEILKGHTHSVYDMVELKDGKLASVSGDNLVIIWKSGKIID